MQNPREHPEIAVRGFPQRNRRKEVAFPQGSVRSTNFFEYVYSHVWGMCVCPAVFWCIYSHVCGMCVCSSDHVCFWRLEMSCSITLHWMYRGRVLCWTHSLPIWLVWLGHLLGIPWLSISGITDRLPHLPCRVCGFRGSWFGSLELYGRHFTHGAVFLVHSKLFDFPT